MAHETTSRQLRRQAFAAEYDLRMVGRIALMSEKTSTAPFYANTFEVAEVARFRPYDFFDIMTVVSGDGRQVSYSGPEKPRTMRLQPGRMVFYRPVDDVMLSSASGMTLTYVSFPVTEWVNFAALVGVDRSWSSQADPPSVNLEPNDHAILEPFDAALRRFRSGTPTLLDLVQFWIDVIPLMFPESHPSFLPGLGAPGWLRDAADAMRDESNLRGGVARMLQLAHVSAAHLSITTRRYFGKTPTEYVLELRLQHAAVLLATTGESIGSIAERCGFRSFTYFSTVFRRHHLIRPRDYRVRSRGRFAPERG